MALQSYGIKELKQKISKKLLWLYITIKGLSERFWMPSTLSLMLQKNRISFPQSFTAVKQAIFGEKKEITIVNKPKTSVN